MSFKKILDKYRKISFSESDKGNRFERLMKAYLLTDPKYAYKLKKIWLWNDFFAKRDLGGHDTGIDLVAQTFDGEYWAIQCKFFQEDATIDKSSIDTFFSTSGRSFKDENLSTKHFAYRLWIDTTGRPFTSNAEETFKNQQIPAGRLPLHDLINSPVDWIKLEEGISGDTARIAKKTLRPHQKEAVTKTNEYYKENDRGKLIMACGTGKTFTSLRIAENETNGKGFILFLVPSIALLGQTLNEWYADAEEPINAICICSDREVSRRKDKVEDLDSTSVIDLAYPASTNVENILFQFRGLKQQSNNGLTVVFSTYQSIEVISKALKSLANLDEKYSAFDLIICDEAHRTTGISLVNEDESAFVKVHNNEFIKAKKRLYMTATPRLYDENAKSKAAQADAVLCSMDDTNLYGEEIYRIGFGEAVEKNLLTDYKVLILTLNENDISPAIQGMIADKESEINTDDASKLIGCINALSKQILGDEGLIKATDPDPMRRAVAFCQSIKISKKITNVFNVASETYISELPENKKDSMQMINSKHIDGTMNATQRNEMLAWLKDEPNSNECRVLTNVRCLSEGIDVPSLDAVLFLSARNSQVDVVQSVGRVMRKAPNKKYGYIIIPIVVPSSIEADKALDDNERYKVVWTVLNALRAHDDRFNAIVNKIELNKKKPAQILVGKPDTTFDKDGKSIENDNYSSESAQKVAEQLNIQFEQLQSVVFARMVQKVGDRRYWEQWAKDVAIIAEKQIERLTDLIKNKQNQRQFFDKFLQGLQKNINPSISESQAIDMLAQHIITRPIFEALFEGYSFVKNNAVSTAMQSMLDALEGKTVAEESETLKKFYDSVRKRAEDIDNAEGKQRIIIELYDKFFKTAFPKMVEQLGIVYTPVEVVDFIIHSVNDVLKKEFDRSISDENIHILDPFTGTGTFITRLLQSGLIEGKDLERKYKNEIHANEIVLLAYYIAAINIENAYHEQIGEESEYEPFEGIVLTDTFQLSETDEDNKLSTDVFIKNTERVNRQKKAQLMVIMGNPPYSVGQNSANDNSQNQEYIKLDSRIFETYQATSTGTGKRALYDSYIKAFRWATDRLSSQNGGIVAYISNGNWIDGNNSVGIRKCIVKDFSSIYIFNLRGNQRTSGELSRKEGGKIFGSGSRTPISITLLVKNPSVKNQNAIIYYYDIGDYLNREEKLSIVKKFGSITKISLEKLTPNEHGDWLNQRNDIFGSFIPLGVKNEKSVNSYFDTNYSYGILSNRDSWVWNSSKNEVEKNIKSTIDFYNSERIRYNTAKKENPSIKVENIITFDSTKITWDARKLKGGIQKDSIINYMKFAIRIGIYRPFNKNWIYFNKDLNHSLFQQPSYFPDHKSENRLICVTGIGGTKENSVLIAETVIDLNCLDAGTQCFPLYYYEEIDNTKNNLFDSAKEKEYKRRDAVSDFILERAKKQYGKNVTKEDIFYYVYGFLHSTDYRDKFAYDLKKMLPRIPLVEVVKDFWAFSKAGRKLADLHINYESVAPHPEVAVIFNPLSISDSLKQLPQDEIDYINYKVQKMRFPKKDQKGTIIYNNQVTIDFIPEKAYQYVVNGKSAIEWIMERYQITTHKESGITNDPNDWSKEVGNPKYILNLLLSIINVSVQTVDIVNNLPKVDFNTQTKED